MLEFLIMSSVPSKKRVRFDDTAETFYHSAAWPEPDYKRARRGRRFQCRVVHLAKILTPFLTDDHRILVRLRNMMYTE